MLYVEVSLKCIYISQFWLNSCYNNGYSYMNMTRVFARISSVSTEIFIAVKNVSSQCCIVKRNTRFIPAEYIRPELSHGVRETSLRRRPYENRQNKRVVTGSPQEKASKRFTTFLRYIISVNGTDRASSPSGCHPRFVFGKFRVHISARRQAVTINPCGGGFKYLYRSPASRRRRWKGNPVPGGVTGPPCSRGM
jgi:hypothetical protein